MSLRIITTVFNAEPFIKQCLDSVYQQTYKDFTHHILDDASTDGTRQIILDWIKEKNDPRFVFWHNVTNLKAIANYVYLIPKMTQNSGDIICCLDGDDYLYGDDALGYVHQTYESYPRTMMTYGQYSCVSSIQEGKIIPGACRPIKSIKDISEPGFNMSHLKTFRKHAWDLLSDEDLRRWDSAYVQKAWDQPLMGNMARKVTRSMGGDKAEDNNLDKIKFIDKILYAYNNLNPISEWRIDESEQMREDVFVRARIAKLERWS